MAVRKDDYNTDDSENTDDNADDIVDDNIRDRFAPYLRIISQFNEILGDDPRTTLRLMKYRIKGILFFNEINNRHRQKSGHKLHDKSSEEYREYWSEVEGLFSDYLENSLLFDAEAGKKGMKTFEQIYKSVLMHKIWMADQKDLNGNYRLLFKCGSDFDDLSEEETVEIVAHELMLDLNYIVDAVAKSNELDEARNYLLYTSASLVNIKNDDEENDDFRDSDMIADLRYERLFLDLIGESIISHDPVQLLYWIFNPAFEEIVGKEVVDPIRDALVSKGFWDYAVSNIEKKLWRRDGKELKRAISRLMPILKQNKEVCRLAIEVSKKINEE